MSETLESIDSSVRERQVFVGALAAVDRKFYDPNYLAELPYVRLELRKFHYSTIPSSRENDRAPGAPYSDEAVVTAVLHRSGVALITIAVTHEDGLSIDDLRARAVSTAPIYGEFTVSETVLAAADRNVGRSPEEIPGEWESGTHEGTRWRTWKENEPLALADIFHMYLSAIDAHLKKNKIGDAWFCFHTLCIDRLDCCSRKSTWLTRHETELVGLTARFESPDALTKEAKGELLGKDWSLRSDHSTYLYPGNAVHIAWDFGAEATRDAVQHFWLTALTDNFLIQLGQLRQITSDLSLRLPTARALVTAQARVLVGLAEFQQSRIAYGTARQMVQNLSEQHGLHLTYQRTLDQLNTLAQVVESRRAKAAVRRDTILTGAGTLAAAVFALPAIQQALQILAVNGLAPRLLQLGTPKETEHTAIAIYSTLMILIALNLVFFAGRHLVSKIRPKSLWRKLRPFGITWPEGPFTVELEQSTAPSPKRP